MSESQPNFFDDSLGKCRERDSTHVRELAEANDEIEKLRARVKDLEEELQHSRFKICVRLREAVDAALCEVEVETAILEVEVGE